MQPTSPPPSAYPNDLFITPDEQVDSLRERFAALPAVHPAERLRLRLGTLHDYAVLAEHHYRARKPATAPRVLVFEDRRPTVVGRYLARLDETRVVAVLVESLPSLSCRMRDWALHDRYGGHLPPKPRAVLLNAEVRCISRVVVDPAWRGLGLAVRLVKRALRSPTTRYTEALAAMGRVNPFFERAGMTAYPRPAHAHDARFVAALARVGLHARDLATLDRTWSHIEAFAPDVQRWLCKELHRWYRLNAGRSADHETDPRKQLVIARERLLLEPVYYLKDHGPMTATV
ncbi:MAG: hypothetical protein AAGA25_07885 [Planctomycetota bacterium]